MPGDSDLESRGRLIRSLGTLREMLPGSFVERKRRCGRLNCHCVHGQNLHSQFQISARRRQTQGVQRPVEAGA